MISEISLIIRVVVIARIIKAGIMRKEKVKARMVIIIIKAIEIIKIKEVIITTEMVNQTIKGIEAIIIKEAIKLVEIIITNLAKESMVTGRRQQKFQ